MTDQTQEIKDRIDIVQFINEYVPLKKAGRNWKALCPFHSEKTPSFMVNPERGIFKCFGCSLSGDVFTFLQKLEGIEFSEALRILADRTGVKLKTYVPDDQDRETERLYQICQHAGRFYAYILQKHKVGAGARTYLKNRGVTAKLIEVFHLGYAPKSWDSLLRFLKRKGYNEAEVEKAGLVIKSEKGPGYYDRFRGRVIFPLKDHQSRIRGFAGRLLDPEAKEAKYINTPETPIYAKRKLLYGLDVAKEAIRRSRQAIVVEGELDMIASYSVGVENAAAIKGSALTEEQIFILKRYADEVLLALDADFAGDEAAKRGIELSDQAGLTVRMIKIPIGKDPDECIRQDPQAWRQTVKEAIPVYDFVIDSALRHYDPQTAKGKQQICREVLPFLGKISDPIVQSHYRKKLARLLNTEEEVLVTAMKKIPTVQNKVRWIPAEPAKQSEVRKPRQESLEERLLALIFQGLHVADDLSKVTTTPTFPMTQRLWEEFAKFIKNKKHFVYTKFAKTLPPELTETADRLYLTDLGDLVLDHYRWQREVEWIIDQLNQFALKKGLRDLSKKLGGAVNSGKIKTNGIQKQKNSQKIRRKTNQENK